MTNTTNTFRKIFIALAFFAILPGFFIRHDQAPFWWHRIPSLDVIIGGAGALLLMIVIKGVASFASKKEDFYD